MSGSALRHYRNRQHFPEAIGGRRVVKKLSSTERPFLSPWVEKPSKMARQLLALIPASFSGSQLDCICTSERIPDKTTIEFDQKNTSSVKGRRVVGEGEGRLKKREKERQRQRQRQR